MYIYTLEQQHRTRQAVTIYIYVYVNIYTYIHIYEYIYTWATTQNKLSQVPVQNKTSCHNFGTINWNLNEISTAPRGAVLNQNKLYKSKGTRYTFKFAEKHSSKPSFSPHGVHKIRNTPYSFSTVNFVVSLPVRISHRSALQWFYIANLVAGWISRIWTVQTHWQWADD